MTGENLIGVGLYTPAESSRLISVPVGKILRWLRGHQRGDQSYEPLWEPQIDLDDNKIYLGFRDLMEVRIADSFIKAGVPPRRVRAAIQLASQVIGDARPLSTDHFRTDGRNIFIKTIERGDDGAEREQLLDLFKRQYAFEKMIAPLLKTVDFGADGTPVAWWPIGKTKHILVDPGRSFGQPIDEVSSVPTAVLAAAGKFQGVDQAAVTYGVPKSSVLRAMSYEESLGLKAAA